MALTFAEYGKATNQQHGITTFLRQQRAAEEARLQRMLRIDQPQIVKTQRVRCPACEKVVIYEAPHVCTVIDRSKYVAAENPPPTTSEQSEYVLPEAMVYLERRAELGYRRYGQYLQTFDGRDTDQDALEEAADQFMYLMKKRMETASANA